MPVVNVPVTSNMRSVGVSPPIMSARRFSSETTMSVSPEKICSCCASRLPISMGLSPEAGGFRLWTPERTCSSISVTDPSRASVEMP